MTAIAAPAGRPLRTLVLAPTAPAVAPLLRLDPAQQDVVDHPGGPLLVLAGPGTGKTSTLVEAVARRVAAGTDPARILVLTFSRRAAQELRERIGVRLGRTLGAPAAWTFHSYCLALLSAERDRQDPAGPLRLLTAPQQEVRVRDLLAGDRADGGGRWPALLRPALGTRGLASEVRALLARARELGWEPADLGRAARAARREDWAAAARFFQTYLDVLDAQGVLDYSELVYRAAALADRPDQRERLRAGLDAVFVDEYQDTDPAQERLLSALAGDGRDLVVVGDPDQSIYAFRGAEVANLLRFADRFPDRAGRPAPVRTLTVCRRCGPALLAASRLVAGRLPAPGLPVPALRRHRDLRPPTELSEGPDLGRPFPGEAAAGVPGSLAAATYASPVAEATAVADLLRRAHLHDGIPWAQMAVLVRSAVRSVPLLSRVLTGAGVPVAAGEDVPLAVEPAVAPLLLALRVCADPAALDSGAVRTLLTSPLVGADSSRLRRLGRALRAVQRASPGCGTGMPAGCASGLELSAAELLRRSVIEPALAERVPDRLARPVRELAALLSAGAEALAGRGVEAALWALWSGSSWPARLEGDALGGGPAGLAADRDLDAVLALFDAVRRHGELTPRGGVRSLLEELEAQEIPGEGRAGRPRRGDAVRLLTAHRSKGLEWELVVVAGVQEGSWPDLRPRGSLLAPDRLGPDGLGELPGFLDLLAEERRLFYVAVTRARSRLLVTAVDSGDGGEERPSRFLAELGVPVAPPPRSSGRPLTLAGMVAELRAVAVDRRRSASQRQAAVDRLARLAAATDRTGAALVPAADPATWWGTRELTRAPERPWPPELPVAMSGTGLAALRVCPLRWLLGRQIGADGPAGTAQGVGRLLHVLAEDVAAGRRPPDADSLMSAVDGVWQALAFEAPWYAVAQRETVRGGVHRLLAWLQDNPRQLVGAELDFDVVLPLRVGEVRLRGRADRVEIDADGGLHVVDFKTGKVGPDRDALDHPQLAVYQLAAQAGAFPAASGRSGPVAGAELVQLRPDGGAARVQRQPPLGAEPEGAPSWIEAELEDAVHRLHTEQFPPRPGEHCERCPFQVCCPARPEGQSVIV